MQIARAKRAIAVRASDAPVGMITLPGDATEGDLERLRTALDAGIIAWRELVEGWNVALLRPRPIRFYFVNWQDSTA